ncbi:MAG: DUF115 domain-containing protein [Spirochaetia bacterium]|jgi:hypothetical protein|nr:DUF115 domain-containing protein [Spirochaetia bacterium]
MLKVIISKTGHKTALYNNIHIHSKIDPQREAEKYLLSRFSLSNQPGVIILLFPGLNYLYEELKKNFPVSRIIIIHNNSELYDYSVASELSDSDAVWHPECGIPLKTFLYDKISETDVKSLTTISWEPVIKAFPAEAKSISSVVAQVLTEYNSNISTTSHFGKRCLKNIIRNMARLESIVSIKKIDKPVVITGSGPSLEKSIPFLKAAKNNIFLIALSSSCSILKFHGILPDLVLTTDPGYYASVHLDYCINQELIISSPLSANNGKSGRNPFLLINQGTFLEEYFFNNIKLPYFRLNPNGTVAGSALFLASLVTEMPVILAGIDFCSQDIKTHSRPHSFERFLNNCVTRVNPLLDIYYNQAVNNYPDKLGVKPNCRVSRQLSAYSGWFNSTIFKESCYRLNPSPVRIDSLKTLTNNDALEMVESFVYTGENSFDIFNKNSTKSANRSDTSKNGIYFSINKIDKKIYIENIKILQNNLLTALENRLTNISAESIIHQLKSGFDKDILYYFDTYGYLELISLMNKNMLMELKEKYKALIKKCISFFVKEFAKTRVLNG